MFDDQENGGNSIIWDVLEEIAEQEGVDIVELPPLQREIDCEALESFIESSSYQNLIVSFTYFGYKVEIEGDGTISASERMRN